MRAPNGHMCSLAHDKPMALALVSDVLRRCTEEFETSVSQKVPLCFELSVFDAVMLQENYDNGTVGLSELLRIFLNEALQMIAMPYRITAVMSLAVGSRFYCHVERAHQHKKRPDA